MRYELSDYEWGVIRPMLPNRPRGVPLASTIGASSTVSSGLCDRVHSGRSRHAQRSYQFPGNAAAVAGEGLDTSNDGRPSPGQCCAASRAR